MKTDTIVLIGGLAIGGYLLWKFWPSIAAFNKGITTTAETVEKTVYYVTTPGWKLVQDTVGEDWWTFLTTPGYKTLGL